MLHDGKLRLWRGEPGLECQEHGWFARAIFVSDHEYACRIVPYYYCTRTFRSSGIVATASWCVQIASRFWLLE
jgi:hypothetical protein